MRTDYQMYSPGGDRMCAETVASIVEDMRNGYLTRLQLPEVVKQACDVAASCGWEIWDTEPQYAIAAELSKVCEELGWNPISRWDW